MRPFELGQLLATPGAIRFLSNHQVDALDLLQRHLKNESDVCPEDRRGNERAVQEGSRIFSVFQIESTKLYVITECDHSATTILLASEY